MSEPNSTKKKKKRPSLQTVWREAREIVWSRRKRLVLGLGLIVAGRLAGMVVPASSKFVIDDVIGNGRNDVFGWILLAAAIATVVQAASSFSLSIILGQTAQRAITEMRMRVQQHVIRLPVSFYDHTKSGELISRVMSDAEGIRNLVGTGLVQLVGGLITASMAMCVLFYLNWQLTTITMVVLITFAALMARAFMGMRPLFRERQETNALVTGRLTEALGGVRVVKAYNAEKREDRIFAKGAHQLLRMVNKTILYSSSVTAGSTLLFGGIWLVAMVIGARSIQAGDMTLGDLVAYFFFTALVAGPLIQISSISTQLSEAFAGLDRIRDLFANETEDQADLERDRLPDVRGDVQLDNVTFSYVEGTPVLSNISLEAPAGSTTALVGSSGSGKSTLIGLIMTFMRPQNGRVLVDGHDLATVRLSDYRQQLGIVLQDNFLFDGTIAENIAYSLPHASREDIEAAGKTANCHGFVTGFDDGYDTLVGERGVKLSGGQRQRVAIARAILADPAILILDEATSSLDSESEAEIQDGLYALRRGRTTFVIAHRLSTIQSADQILVIEDGEIVERGNHEHLLSLDGRYRELYEKQHKLEANRFINPGEELREADDDDDDTDVKTVRATPSNRL